MCIRDRVINEEEAVWMRELFYKVVHEGASGYALAEMCIRDSGFYREHGTRKDGNSSSKCNEESFDVRKKLLSLRLSFCFTDKGFYLPPVSYTHLDVYKRQIRGTLSLYGIFSIGKRHVPFGRST